MDMYIIIRNEAWKCFLPDVYMQYQREASALLVLLRWVMPEPPIVERVTGTDLTLFFYFNADEMGPEASVPRMKTALLITTYNSPASLRVVLESVYNQTTLPDQIIIADDGSDDDTRRVADSVTQKHDVEVKYVWHEDKGFRLSKIRNRAIAVSDADYIVMIDGDVVLHRNFIQDHIEQAKPGYFVCGIRALITDEYTDRYKKGSLTPSLTFLSGGIRKRIWALRSPLLSRCLATHHKNSVRQVLGSNLSFWRNDAVAVNGFNEDFEGWGCEDRDMAVRFYNYGLKRHTLIFRAIQFHLHHEIRTVKDLHLRNRKILNETRVSGAIRCKNGIDKYLD